jgi:hypothetical protein
VSCASAEAGVQKPQAGGSIKTRLAPAWAPAFAGELAIPQLDPS